MNWALWKKAIADAYGQLLASCLILIVFAWVFVWLTGQVRLGAWTMILDLLPRFVNRILGVSPADLVSLTGRLSLLYLHVVPLLVFMGWAIGRGSHVVSGSIADGTLELLLTMPVWRVSVLVAPSVIAALGTVLLGLSLWFGIWLGLLTVPLEGRTSIWAFLPGTINMVALSFCLLGLTTFLSSLDRDRWRTIWAAGALVLVEMIIKMIARLWEPGAWLAYFSFLTPFEPQTLILMGEKGWTLSLQYNGSLLLLGVLGYVGAGLVLSWRDIPVPR